MRIRVALCQLETHPALCASHVDLLEEPFYPPGSEASLSHLGLKGVDVADLQRQCREGYLRWAAGRLEAVFTQLQALDPQPQLVLFPEGGIPPEHLDRPVAYSAQTGATVLAGSHTPRTGARERAAYLAAGVEGAALDRLLAADCRNALPLVRAGETTLVPKALLSPLDRSVIEGPLDAAERRTHAVTFGDRRLELLPLICSEALQHPRVEGAPELVAICAYDAKPGQFSSFCVEQVRNKRLVLLCNDGQYGGSRVFAPADTRRHDWLREALPDGMPAGDALLVVDLDLDARAVEVGTATPAMAVQLVSIRSVLADGSAAARCSARLQRIRALEDPAHRARELQNLLGDRDLQKLQRTRIHAIAEQERRGLPCSSWWDTLGDDVLVSDSVSLRETERQLAARCIEDLRGKVTSGREAGGTLPLVDFIRRCEAVGQAPPERATPTRTAPPASAGAPSPPEPVERAPSPHMTPPPAPVSAGATSLGFDPGARLALTMHANPGAYACLLGSGISFASGIPTGWEVVLDLSARVARVLGEDCGDDPAGWYRARFGEEPDYARLLARIAPTPAERSRLLRGYFEPTEEEHRRGIKGPTPAHRALAALAKQGVVRLFVTTNFDRLLERALQEVNVAPMVISGPDDLAGVPPSGMARRR